MIKKSLPLAVSAALLTASASLTPEPAMATGMIAGSTEITQLLNYGQLTLSYAKQVSQASNQLLQYRAQLKQLENLDPTTLSGILKGVNSLSAMAELTSRITTVDEMSSSLQGISTGLDTLYKEGKIADSVASKLTKAGVAYSDGNYVSMMKALASLHVEDYAERLTALQTSVSNVQSDMTRLDNLSAASSAITSDVGGLQAVVQSNALIGKMLGGVQTTLAQSAEMDVEQAKYLMKLSDSNAGYEAIRQNMGKSLFVGDTSSE